MSWDSYIDNLIAQSKDASGNGHADRACIIGLDGGAPWTTAGHANALQVRVTACCVPAVFRGCTVLWLRILSHALETMLLWLALENTSK